MSDSASFSDGQASDSMLAVTIHYQLSILPVLAAVDLRSPLLWAVVLGWMLSVVLHELAHGFAGHLGGDYTLRGRGGLSLNPFQYVDPFTSVVLPMFFLLNGGIPLVGGVTYIREDLLRSRVWVTAVALAGPAMNLLLFLLLLLPMHPRIGWLHTADDIRLWTPFQLCLATLGSLQFLGAIINLIPIPPLDGFNAIKPFLDANSRAMLTSPQSRLIGFFVLYFVVFRVPAVMNCVYIFEHRTLNFLGFDTQVEMFREAYNKVLFNE